MQSLSLLADSLSSPPSPEPMADDFWQDLDIGPRRRSPSPVSQETPSFATVDADSSQSQSQGFSSRRGGRKRMLLHSSDENVDVSFSFGSDDDESHELEEEAVDDDGSLEPAEEEDDDDGWAIGFSQAAQRVTEPVTDTMDDIGELDEEDEAEVPRRAEAEDDLESGTEAWEDDWDLALPPQASQSQSASSQYASQPSSRASASSASSLPPSDTSEGRQKRRKLAKDHIERNLLLPFLSQLAHSLTLIPEPRVPLRRSSHGARQSQSGSSPSQSQGRRSSGTKRDGLIRLDVLGWRKEADGGGQFVWPGGKKTTSRDLARVCKVLSMMHDALKNEFIVTKRDIYYKDTQLFGSQSVVDRIVETIVSSAGLKRSDFNVRASPKGLWSSKLVEVVLVDALASGNDQASSQDEPDEILGCGDMHSTLIPPNETIKEVRIADDHAEEELQWILVIEKDAIFQTLCSIKFGAEHGVLVTGKGFPDQSSAHFVFSLAERFPNTPVLALVDGDPDGLEILSTYRFGSKTAAKLNQECLGVDRIEWLGVKGSEWSSLDINFDLLIPLSARDQKKIHAFLKRPAEQLPDEWRRELCDMLHLRHKAEIQLLSSATSPRTSSTSASTSQPSSLANRNQSMFDDALDADADADETDPDLDAAGSAAKVAGRGRRLVDYLEERIGAAVKRAGKNFKKGDDAAAEGRSEDEGLGSSSSDIEIDWGGSGVFFK